jgi:hypothetical protein
MELLLTLLLLLTIPGLVTYLIPDRGEPVRTDS